MRKFDKKKNIEKANILAEQRFLASKGIIKEDDSTQNGGSINISTMDDLFHDGHFNFKEDKTEGFGLSPDFGVTVQSSIYVLNHDKIIELYGENIYFEIVNFLTYNTKEILQLMGTYKNAKLSEIASSQDGIIYTINQSNGDDSVSGGVDGWGDMYQ